MALSDKEERIFELLTKYEEILKKQIHIADEKAKVESDITTAQNNGRQQEAILLRERKKILESELKAAKQEERNFRKPLSKTDKKYLDENISRNNNQVTTSNGYKHLKDEYEYEEEERTKKERNRRLSRRKKRRDITDAQERRNEFLQDQRDNLTRKVGGDAASKLQEGSFMKAKNAFKSGGPGGKVGGAIMIANMVGEAVSAIANAVGDYKLKSIDIEREELSAHYDILNRELETQSKLFKKKLELWGKGLQKQFSNTTSFITQGVQESAYQSAESSIEIGADLLKYKIEEAFQKFSLETYKNERTQEAATKIGNLERERTLGVTNSILDGIDSLTGGILGGVTGAIKAVSTNAIKVQNAQNMLNLEKYKQELEYTLKQKELVNELMQDMTDKLSSFANQGLEFAKSIENAGLRIDKSIKEGVKLFGFNGDGIQNYISSIDNTMSMMYLTDSNGNKRYLDKTEEDIVNFQDAYINDSNRNIQLNTNDLIKGFSLGKLWGDETITQLTSGLDYFNMSMANSSDLLFEMYQSANKLGISNKKYAKDLQQNLKLAQKYTFKGGVEAMMKMSLWAQQARFNMESLDSMISQSREGGLEGIITKGAQMQVLGGAASMGADPLAMMYEMWADPEKYGKRMYKMTEGIGHFNNNTGQVELNGNEAMWVQALAKAQGRDYSELVNEINQRLKGERIDKQITRNYTDEQKSLLYSKAQFNTETQSWEVTNSKGETMDINNLTETDFAELLPHEEKIENYVANILDYLAQMNGAKNHAEYKMAMQTRDELETNINKRITDDIDWVEDYNNQLLSIIKNAYAFTTEQNEEWKKHLTDNTSLFTQSLQTLTPDFKELDIQLQKASKMMKAFAENADKSVDVMFKKMQEILGVEIPNIVGQADIDEKMKYEDAWDYFYDEAETYNEVVKGLLKLREQYKNNEIDDRKLLTDARELFEKGWGTGNEDLATALHSAGITDSNSATSADLKVVKKVIETIPTTINNEGYELVRYRDGFIPSNNEPIITNAKNITPINDGSVQLAQSHPKDSAIFAKTGGPFDTLFNDIFGQINSVYDFLSNNSSMTTTPRSYNNEVFNSLLNNISNNSSMITSRINNGSENGVVEVVKQPYLFPEETIERKSEKQISRNEQNNLTLKLEPIRIEGKIELDSNGQSIDLMSELQKNPILLRNLTQMISDTISKNVNGGRSNGNTMMGRFKDLTI